MFHVNLKLKPPLEPNRVKLVLQVLVSKVRPSPSLRCQETLLSVYSQLFNSFYYFLSHEILTVITPSGYIEKLSSALLQTYRCSPTRRPFSARFPAATTGTLIRHKGHIAQCTCTFFPDLGLPSARNSKISSPHHHRCLVPQR